jgi:hypothetical protein
MPTPKRFTNRPGRPGFAPRALFGPAAALAIPGLLAFVSTLGNAPRVAASSDAEMQRSLDRQFTTTVRPFLKTYCAPCHGKADSEAALNVETYGNLAAVIGDDTHWNHILDKLAAGQMPPSTARKQPSAVEREAVLAWINAMRQWEALQRKDTGDPGPVLARRLSNAEYDYTIRDLTGVDLHPTREFPVDPANQEGFDNSGESLTLSGALVKKYVDSATDIANHMVLTSTGITFATHPVLVETDQDKFCILRIVDFYKHQPTDFADYFAAAWRYRYRDVLHTPKASLASLAADAHISPRYLTLVWETLNGSDNAVGPLATLRTKWNALPPPDSANPGAPRDGCTALRDWVAGLRTASRPAARSLCCGRIGSMPGTAEASNRPLCRPVASRRRTSFPPIRAKARKIPTVPKRPFPIPSIPTSSCPKTTPPVRRTSPPSRSSAASSPTRSISPSAGACLSMNPETPAAS